MHPFALQPGTQKFLNPSGPNLGLDTQIHRATVQLPQRHARALAPLRRTRAHLPVPALPNETLIPLPPLVLLLGPIAIPPAALIAQQRRLEHARDDTNKSQSGGSFYDISWAERISGRGSVNVMPVIIWRGGGGWARAAAVHGRRWRCWPPTAGRAAWPWAAPAGAGCSRCGTAAAPGMMFRPI
jgi:hypothetical protein